MDMKSQSMPSSHLNPLSLPFANTFQRAPFILGPIASLLSNVWYIYTNDTSILILLALLHTNTEAYFINRQLLKLIVFEQTQHQMKFTKRYTFGGTLK